MGDGRTPDDDRPPDFVRILCSCGAIATIVKVVDERGRLVRTAFLCERHCDAANEHDSTDCANCARYKERHPV